MLDDLPHVIQQSLEVARARPVAQPDLALARRRYRRRRARQVTGSAVALSVLGLTAVLAVPSFDSADESVFATSSAAQSCGPEQRQQSDAADRFGDTVAAAPGREWRLDAAYVRPPCLDSGLYQRVLGGAVDEVLVAEVSAPSESVGSRNPLIVTRATFSQDVDHDRVAAWAAVVGPAVQPAADGAYDPALQPKDNAVLDHQVAGDTETWVSVSPSHGLLFGVLVSGDVVASGYTSIDLTETNEQVAHLASALTAAAS